MIWTDFIQTIIMIIGAVALMFISKLTFILCWSIVAWWIDSGTLMECRLF